MFERPEILRMAEGLLAHSNARQSEIARNVANADTPGYRARDVVSFAEAYEAQSDAALRQTRTGHVGSNDAQAATPNVIDRPDPSSPNGNSVTLENEVLAAAEVNRAHDTALAIYRSSMTILRLSIGRG